MRVAGPAGPRRDPRQVDGAGHNALLRLHFVRYLALALSLLEDQGLTREAFMQLARDLKARMFADFVAAGVVDLAGRILSPTRLGTAVHEVLAQARLPGCDPPFGCYFPEAVIGNRPQVNASPAPPSWPLRRPCAMLGANAKPGGRVAPVGHGTVVSVRGNVADARFPESLPALFNELRAGSDGAARVKVVLRCLCLAIQHLQPLTLPLGHGFRKEE